MSFYSRLLVFSRSVLRKAYTPRVKSTAKKLGLATWLRSVYDRIDMNTSDTIEFSVGDTSIRIQPKSVAQAESIQEWQGAEGPIMRDLLDNLQPDDVFYDVGAWIGTYSCLVAKAAPDVEVHAFEPGSERGQRLEQHVALNDVDITTHHVGLASVTESLHLSENGQVIQSPSETSETVRIVDAMAYISDAEIQAPTVVKIDVEGGETDVVEGLAPALERPACRLVYCEVHPQNGVDVVQFCETLESLGFEVERLHNRKSVVFVKAEKRTEESDN